MPYTKKTYLLQASFTPEQIDALIADGYKAYDRFAEAYLNYSNEVTKPATFTVYGGSYTMKNSEVPVVIDAATTDMTISSVLYDGTYYNENTIFELTATDFTNNGTLNISKAAEDESLKSVTFKSNATFTNNNSVSVSNAIFDVANVVNTATFNLTDGAAFAATTVTNSGTFNLTGDAMFDAATVTNSGTIKLTDAGFGADVVNTGAIYVYGKDTEINGKFTGEGSINYMAGTSSEKKGAQKNDIIGDNTINFLTQTDGNRRFFTASDFDVVGAEINIVGTSVSFSGNTTLTAGELNVASYTNEAGTKTYDGAVKITGRTVGEQIANNVSLNIGELNGQITLTDVAIKGSNISGEDASLVMKDAVSISGVNVFNADIANSGTLSIAGSEDVPTSLNGVQELTNSGSGKVTIDGKAEVTVESIVNKNAGKITVSNGATLNAGSISNKKAGSYVQTIAVEGGTLIADSVNTTANFNVTGASKLKIGAEEGAAGLTGTITLGDADNTATLSESVVKGGALDVAGTVTLSGVNNLLSDITVNGTLAIDKNATLNASSLTVENTLSLGAGSTVTLDGDLVSSKALTIQSATVKANAITAEGKALAFITSNITADTITAASAQVRGNSTLNIDHLGDTVMTIKSVNAQTTTTITNSSIDAESSVTTQVNVKFVGENTFGAITNEGNLTVAGSLTASSITSDNATFTVSDAGTKLNIGKFTGTITFADGATLGDSSFGADSVITATNFAIAEGAAVTLTVGEATKLNANISSGTINLVSGFDTGSAPEWEGLYQLIDGTIGADVTFTVDGVQAGSIKLGDETYGLIKLDTGLWLTKGQDNETLYINESYAGLTPGAKTTDGHIYGYNAFASLRDSALSYSATGVDQDVKDAAKNAKNLVLTGAITNGRTLFYTDQPTVTITTGEGGASFTERLYLMHDIIYKKDGNSFVVYDKDGETPIAQATLPEFILAEGAKLNGGSMLKVGESLDKSDYNTDTDKFTRTAGAVKLTVNGDIKSFIQVNPYSSATVSKTGSVISAYNGSGVTQDEDQQCTYIRVNGSLTVNGDAEAEVKELQFKMQRLSFADGGTLALNNTNAQFSRIRFYDENFTIPTGTATITVTNSIVDEFAGNNLDNIGGGYNFFVYGASETAEVKSKQKVELTLDNSVMNVSDKAVFNPNANTTITVKNGSALTVGKVENGGAINVTGASSTLTAGTIENSRTITVDGSALNATVVDTSAEGAKFTVGGTSTLNISGTSSSLTGTITLADGANVKATIAKGGTLDVAADTAATLAAGTSVASAITNAGTLTLNSVTKTGRITNNGTVSGSASTVGGITNNAGSVTLTGKSFSSVSVKAGAVSLTAENAETKAIAVGSITNGTKGTKTAEAIDGTFAADGNVTGSGAITNYAGSINVTGSLTLTQNKTTFVCPAITNGSIYTSGTTVQVGVGSIEVKGDLTAGDIVNGIDNGATEPVKKSFITAANITADSITNYGTVGSQVEGKKLTTLTVTGALTNNLYGDVFAGTLNAGSIVNKNEIDVGAIEITSAAGTFLNEAGAKATVGSSVSAKAITNNGYLQTGENGTITATALTNGAYVAATGDGFIEAGSIAATGDISNAGTIEAGSIVATAITNGIAATTEPEPAAAVEGTIKAGSIVATGDITNNAGEIIVSGTISGASVSTVTNAGSIEAGSISVATIDNSGSIGTDKKAVEITTTGDITNNGTINASSISAGNIVNAYSDDKVRVINVAGNVTATKITNSVTTTNPKATYTGKFNISGESELSIGSLVGTITLADGANVTAMVKGGTLDVENGSTVSLVGETGNTATVTNLGELTIAGGVFGAVTNKQVVVDETTVSGTLTVAAAEGADAIQTGAFVNNADVNVKSEFTVKGNFTNSGTITIDASKFVLGDDNTVEVISVTGTLTNNGDIVVVNIPEGETRQVFVKNDGDNKGVYLFGGKADMTELLVYSDLANEYDPGASFSFAGHGYVYAVNAFASANAITQIADDTEFIHFVPQDEVYGNLNLNLSATQDLTVDMINATGRLVAGTFNFNNLIIASEVTEPNDDDEGITAGSIEFINDVATGTNATVSIAAATAVFEGADFSESKSVTIQEKADVTFGEFSAKAVTIDDSVVSIEEGATANTVTIKNGSEVDFEGTVTIGTEGSTATVLSITGDSRVNCDELTKTSATIVNGNVVITNSDMDFDGVATINGNVTISGTTLLPSEVEFDRDTTITGKLTLGANSVIEADQGFSFTAGSSEINGEFYATNKDDENPSGNMTVALGTLTGKGKIFTDVSSTLAFTLPDTKPFTGTIDVDVTGLTATKNAPATITGITEGLRNNNLTISGKNASNNWAKYFAFDAEEKTLTLLEKATNVITATGNTNINKALNYSWTGSDDVVYYADNVVIEGGAASTLYLQGNGSYVTLDGEYTVGIYGGKEMTKTAADTTRSGVSLGGDINIAIEDGSFTKVVVGGDRINTTDATTKYMNYYRDADINLTINGGTFNNYVAAGMMYQGDYLKGYAEIENTNLTITGGTFNMNGTKGGVFGGNFATTKTGSVKTTVLGSSNVKIIAGEEDIVLNPTLYVGSYGSGAVGSTSLTFTGNQEEAETYLKFHAIWGGCSNDLIKKEKDALGSGTYDGSVVGTRTLSFTGFKGAIDCDSINCFSDVVVENSTATLSDKCDLSNVQNWNFDTSSTLVGAFKNDFKGDTFVFSGDVAEGIDSWNVFENVGDLKDTFGASNSFSSVKLFSEVATWDKDASAFASTNYTLSLQTVGEGEEAIKNMVVAKKLV